MTEVKIVHEAINDYVSNLILPLAQEGALDASVAREAMEMYIEEMETVGDPNAVITITMKDEWKIFHPFNIAPFQYEGKEWPSIMHYFSAARFLGTSDEFAEEIRTAPSPQVAHRRSANASLVLHVARSDWEKVKEEELKNGYRALLKQYPEYTAKLIQTKQSGLVYEHKTDKFLGYVPSGHGANKVGVVLTELRAELQ